MYDIFCTFVSLTKMFKYTIMENDIKEISLRNYLDVLNGLAYGTQLVSYANNDVRNEVVSAIETINKIAGLEIVREEAHVEGWEDEVIEGVYDIIYTDRHSPMPQITEDDLNVSHYVKDACENKTLIKLEEVNPALYKHVRKLCKDFDVKFSTDGTAIVLDGRGKSQSVYRQIQEAYKSGKASISFNLDEVNAPTVRTYSSQFGSAIGLKLRCVTAPGFITVHFKEADPRDVLLQELSDRIAKLASLGFTYNDLQEKISNITWAIYGEENTVAAADEPVSGKAWQKHSEAMKNDFGKFAADVIPGIAKMYKEQDIIKEVEALQQYVMPIADAEPRKPTVEYDDF